MSRTPILTFPTQHTFRVKHKLGVLPFVAEQRLIKAGFTLNGAHELVSGKPLTLLSDMMLFERLARPVLSGTSSGSSSTEGGLPMDSVSLNFVRITFEPMPFDSTNESGQPESAEYELAAGGA